MTLSLRAVLDHPLMRGADPAVPDPHADLDRPVRWVHSSEIYEIAPLLRGDELLLTTGLGLAGRDAGERRRYVTELAAAGVAGVALEVGRTFREVPDDVVRAAADAGLPLVVLRGVVPFVEIAEAVNAAILDSAVTRLRHVNRIVRTLSGVLAKGAGVEELTTTLSTLTGRPVVLAALDGTLTAYAGTDDPTSVVRSPTAEAGVELRGALWGRLLLGATKPSAPDATTAKNTTNANHPPTTPSATDTTRTAGTPRRSDANPSPGAAGVNAAGAATGGTRTAGTSGAWDTNPSPGAAGAANPQAANTTTPATQPPGTAGTTDATHMPGAASAANHNRANTTTGATRTAGTARTTNATHMPGAASAANTTTPATQPPGTAGTTDATHMPGAASAANHNRANTTTGATRTAGTARTTNATHMPGAASAANTTTPATQPPGTARTTDATHMPGAADPLAADTTPGATETARRPATPGVAAPHVAPADGPWSTAGAAIAREVAEHAAQVFAPALLRLADRGGWVGRERRELVEGLLGDALPPREVAARLTVCGLVPAGTAVWATVALSRPDPVQAVTTLYEGLRACGGRGLVSDGPGGAYALIALDRPTHIAELADRLGLPTAAGPEPTAALGPLVRDVARVGHSLRAARDTLRLARRVHPIRPTGVAETVLADDWALERLLDGLPPEELADLVEDQLGPLLAADATRGTGLVDTLEAYLRCGCSKTETAGVLFLRRQSVHQRLALIESLLHVSPDAPDRQGPLRAALTARDLLTTRGPNPT
ncbi:PucR family transcriptional regulator ligand-binding domain-containing protein [Embleya scabrispora]|nr:PucR family transcriptional regulator ligand-binding domain-containing protein [Embleya scabrispora]